MADDASMADQLDHALGQQTDHRLGARFETLIAFGLSRLPALECVARRLQIADDERTLGEFDFIVRNLADGTLEHWEVACKFYLGVFRDGELDWVGPGKRDSLRRKLSHLDDRQLRLSSRSEAQSALPQPITRVRAILKGRLFFPFGLPAASPSSFSFDGSAGHVTINPAAPHGTWCPIDTLCTISPSAIHSLHKQDWLAPRRTGASLSLDRLQAAVESGPQCVDVETSQGEWKRMFVVANDWSDDLAT